MIKQIIILIDQFMKRKLIFLSWQHQLNLLQYIFLTTLLIDFILINLKKMIIRINNLKNLSIHKKFYEEIIWRQINLAKSHGIFGFAIYYNFPSKIICNKEIDILEMKNLKFPFLLICIF